MANKQTSRQPSELADEALDRASGGNLGDTATHEVGHLRKPGATSDPDRPIVIWRLP